MVRQLHGQDTTFLHLETPQAHMGITLVYFYDQSSAPGGKIRFKDILQHVDSRIGDSPVFRRKLERMPLDLDYPYWVDDEFFDVEFHMRHVALPKPGDWRQLCIQLSRFHVRPLDLARPLWEMCVIEGLDNVEGLPPGSFAIATKIHHAVIDGHTAMELTWNLHDQTPDAVRTIERPDETPRTSPYLPEKVARLLLNNLAEPLKLAKPLGRALPKLIPTAAHHYWNQLVRKDKSLPKTRFQAPLSVHRVWDMVTYDFEAFRAVKNRVAGATINDVVLATVAGALRLYLDDKGELPDRTLRAMAPINIRSEKEMDSAGNQISMFFPDLPVEIPDPVERFKAVVVSTTDSKELAHAIGAREMADINKHVPPVTLALASKLTAMTASGGRLISTLFETVVTNVPGPQQPLYMLGARLVNFNAVAPLADGVGLLHGINSYDGRINIGFTACRRMMPDPGFYHQCLQRSFDELFRAIADLPAPSSAASKVAGKPKGNARFVKAEA